MIIQNILFPRPEICDEKEMYFREGETLSLGTYCNAFSIGKWRKYTNLDNLSLRLEYDGKAEIKGYHALGSREIQGTLGNGHKQRFLVGSCTCRELPVEIQETEKGCRICFTELPEDGILYVTLRDCGGLKLHGGAYETESVKCNEVNLALGICTYRREDYVKKNVTSVIREAIENPDSPLYEHLEVFISDNGQTLAKDLFANRKIHIFPNKNAGGAGGFTRTMMEAFLRREDSPFTHIILMDDDIVLDYRVLERTYHFLEHVKEECRDMMLGGEMFRLDRRYVQYEAGGVFRNLMLQACNQEWDMRKPEYVAANEIENPVNFSGWWYQCIPRSFVRKDNLPLPIFIHYDDVEYGIRNPAGTILLNGICVWHPQGPNKASASMEYYNIRNDLIAACGSSEHITKRRVISTMAMFCAGHMLKYRYRAVDCILYAVEEFLKGPDYFMEIEPVQNHKKIAEFNYPMLTPEEAGVDLSDIKHETVEEVGKGAYVRALLAGWFLPAKNTTRVSGDGDIGCAFRAKRLYVYDEEKKSGILTEKSYKEAFRIAREYLRICKRIIKEFDACRDQWAEKKPSYTSMEFWETYLELD